MGNTIGEDIFGIPEREKTINSKQKGNRNEIVAAKWLKEWTGQDFARTPSSGGLRWGKDASFACGDVVCQNQNFSFCFAVETKHLKSVEIAEFLRDNSKVYTIFRQASRDAERARKQPLVMLRINGMPAGKYWIFTYLGIIERLNFMLKADHINTKGEGIIVGECPMGDGSVRIAGVSSDLMLKVPYQKFAEAIEKM